ncbi:MAG: DMT family transporter [Rhodospirillales bacterium]|nr:DMT family transporter [Rhodospirillales bacterium]
MSRSDADADLIKGAAFLVAGFTVIPLMDVAAKDLGGQGYAPVLVAWARFAISAVVLSPILLKTGTVGQMTGPGWKMQVFRAVMLASATVLFFSALVTMPMADALAVYFVYPFLITLLAPLLLSEKVGIRRFLAVLIGFCGSLLIIRPGFQEVPAGVYYVLAASVCFALFNLLTRRLSGSSDPWVTVFYQSVVGAVVLTPFIVPHWQLPDLRALGLIAMIIFAAVIGHWLLVKAYEQAPASLLAPFGYFEMVAAVVLGYLWFGDFPDELTWCGIAVIIATGIYISVRERKRKQVLRARPDPQI